MESSAGEPRSVEPNWFATTHWSVVLKAAVGNPQGEEALDKLCRTYWSPVKSYLQASGSSPENAEDLTQEFFERFLKRQQYRLADPNRGKFRSFLLTAVKRFAINEWQRRHALKRGGKQETVSFDNLEQDIKDQPAEMRTADWEYERSWCLTVLANARARLQQEFAERGKAERFTLLETFLPGTEGEMSYAEVARRMDLTETAIRSEVHRLKRRYRDALRHEVANTVGLITEIDDELRHLLAILSRPGGGYP